MKFGLKKLCKAFSAAVLAGSSAFYSQLTYEAPVVDSDDQKLREAIIDIREDQAQEFYSSKEREIREYFKDEGFVVAQSLFEILVKTKSKGTRKDTYSPKFSHEIDQLLPKIRALKENSEFAKDREKIEEKHGSLELYFCAQIVHDMGEDENIFYQDLVDMLRVRVHENMNHETANSHSNIILPAQLDETIKRVGRSMERLTFLRKFDQDEFGEVTGEALEFSKQDIKALKKGEPINLIDQYGYFFWEKINYSGRKREDENKNLQVYAVWDKKKDIPRVVVTQYGRSDKYGACWNAYMNELTHHIYDLMTKLEDRISNLATRFGPMSAGAEVENFDMEGHKKYFEDTRVLLELVAAGKMTAEHFPNTPLEKYIDSLNAQLGKLDTIAAFFIRHHPQYDKNLLKGNDPAQVKAKYIYMSRFYDEEKRGDSNLMYGYAPDISHPDYKIMQQLGDVVDPSFTKGHKKLWHSLVEVIGGEGTDFNKNMMERLVNSQRKVRELANNMVQGEMNLNDALLEL